MKIGKTLKRIYSTPLIFLRVFRKSKIDNFFGGLIVGSIFSLLVNVMTIQVQEMVQRQRVLEAIENEIFHNVVKSNLVMEEYNRSKEDEELLPNYFYTFTPYSSELMSQSPEMLQYTAQIDPDIQIKINTYYRSVLRSTNDMLEKLSQLAKDELSECYFKYEDLSEKEIEKCTILNSWFLNAEVRQAKVINDRSLSVLSYFHPTLDRLNNPVLRTLMGTESIKALSSR